jgi:hypothetical protein
MLVFIFNQAYYLRRAGIVENFEFVYELYSPEVDFPEEGFYIKSTRMSDNVPIYDQIFGGGYYFQRVTLSPSHKQFQIVTPGTNTVVRSCTVPNEYANVLPIVYCLFSNIEIGQNMFLFIQQPNSDDVISTSVDLVMHWESCAIAFFPHTFTIELWLNDAWLQTVALGASDVSSYLDSETHTVSYTSTIPSNVLRLLDLQCVDDPGFLDANGFNCFDWAAAPSWCDLYPSSSSLNGQLASDACCVCGGGLQRRFQLRVFSEQVSVCLSINLKLSVFQASNLDSSPLSAFSGYFSFTHDAPVHSLRSQRLFLPFGSIDDLHDPANSFGIGPDRDDLYPAPPLSTSEWGSQYAWMDVHILFFFQVTRASFSTLPPTLRPRG